MTWQAVSSHSGAIQVVNYSHPGASHAAGSRIQPAGNQPSISNLMGVAAMSSQEQPGDGLVGSIHSGAIQVFRIQPFRSQPGSRI